MRQMDRNIKLITTVFAVAFSFLLVYFGYQVMTEGGRWFVSPSNQRLGKQLENITPGDILDRAGTTLASSDESGNRTYSDDAALRLGSAHVLGDHTGYSATGVQTYHANTLLGFNNSLSGQLGQLMGGKRQGSDMRLTLLSSMQKAAWEYLSGKKGAAVVLNYKTGEVLCSVSSPAFEPANAAQEAKGADAETNGIFVNRVTQGKYAPGSIFKIVTASALLKNDMGGLTHTCTGTLQLPGGTVTCEEAHGACDLNKAMTVSCNTYFANAGVKLGYSALLSAAEDLGFEDDFTFSDLSLYKGRVPEPENDFELGWASVGQNKDTMTPMQAAMMVGAVANDGVMMEPKLVLGITENGGEEKNALNSNVYRTSMNAEVADTLKSMLLNTVQNGTGRSAQVKGLSIGGKTGTAEVSTNKEVAPHAWFVGFLDDESMPLCVAVIVENGGYGSGAAAPLAGQLLKIGSDYYHTNG